MQVFPSGDNQVWTAVSESRTEMRVRGHKQLCERLFVLVLTDLDLVRVSQQPLPGPAGAASFANCGILDACFRTRCQLMSMSSWCEQLVAEVVRGGGRGGAG